MTPFDWFFFAGILTICGQTCADYTKQTRGPGSWAIDEQLKYLAGGFVALALVAIAMGIAGLVEVGT